MYSISVTHHTAGYIDLNQYHAWATIPIFPPGAIHVLSSTSHPFVPALPYQWPRSCTVPVSISHAKYQRSFSRSTFITSHRSWSYPWWISRCLPWWSRTRISNLPRTPSPSSAIHACAATRSNALTSAFPDRLVPSPPSAKVQFASTASLLFALLPLSSTSRSLCAELVLPTTYIAPAQTIIHASAAPAFTIDHHTTSTATAWGAVIRRL